MSPLRVGHILVYAIEGVVLWIFGFSNIVMKGNLGLAVAGLLYAALGWSTSSTLQRTVAYWLHRGLMRGMDSNLVIQLAAAGAWVGYGPTRVDLDIRAVRWIFKALPIMLSAIHQFGFLLSESSYIASTTSGGLGYFVSGDSIFPHLNLTSSPSDLGRAETLLGPGSIAFVRPWEEWQPGRTNVTTVYTSVPAFTTNMSFNDDLAIKEGWNSSCAGSDSWKSATEAEAPFVYIYMDITVGVWSGNCTIAGCEGHLVDVDGDSATALSYDYLGYREVSFGSVDGEPIDYDIVNGSIWQYVCKQMYIYQPQQVGPGLALYARTFTFLDVGDSARMELATALHNALEKSYLTEQGLYQVGVGTQPQKIQDHQDAKTTWTVLVVARVQFASWLKILTIIWIAFMAIVEILISLKGYNEGVIDIGVPAMIGMSGMDDIYGSCSGQPQAGTNVKVVYATDGYGGHLRFAMVGSPEAVQAKDISSGLIATCVGKSREESNSNAILR